MSIVLFAGVDVSRDSLDVAILTPDAKLVRETRFPNTPDGADRLVRCLEAVQRKFEAEDVTCAFESTGDFHLLAAKVLLEAGFDTRIANPAGVKNFAKAKLKDCKTDRGDARLIADYVRVFDEDVPVFEVDDNLEDLKLMTRSRRDLIEDRTAAKNRVHKLLRRYFRGFRHLVSARITDNVLRVIEAYPSPSEVLAAGENTLASLVTGTRKAELVSRFLRVAELATRKVLSAGVRKILVASARAVLAINRQLAELDAEIAVVLAESFPDQQLTSIPGIGPVTAATVLAEVGDGARFPDKTRFVGYCGLYPTVWESGTVQRRFRMTWKGNRHLKMALMVATASARQHNPTIRALYERLRARGKSKMAAGGAIARKLAEIVYVILTRKESWDAAKASAGVERAVAMTTQRVEATT